MKWGFLSFLLGCLTSLPVLAVDYGYDDLNRLKFVDYGGGQRIDYNYNAAGNIEQIIKTAGTAINGFCGYFNGQASEYFPEGPAACVVGTVYAQSISAADFVWSCEGLGGGQPASCSAQRAYKVTANVLAGPGSVTPSQQSVTFNQAAVVTATANTVGYAPSFSSNCGGKQNGYTFATGPVSSDCLVTVTFIPSQTLQFGASTYTFSESGTSVTIPVTRVGGTTGTLTVQYSTVNGSASAGTDYTAKTGILTFAPGITSQSIVIPITNDTAVESAENFVLNLSNPTGGAGIGTNGEATITLTDNDTQIELGLTGKEVNEPAGTTSGSVTLPVTRSGIVSGASSVSWAASNGTATAGSDYGTKGSTVLPAGILSFAAGVTTLNLTVPIHGDVLAEGNETFSLTLKSATGAVLGGQKTATITLLDEEKGIKFAASAVTANEGAGTAVLTVNRTGNATGQLSVNYTTANGTASAGSDYITSNSNLVWGDGDLSAKTIAIPLADDALVEPSETFTVALSAPSAGASIAGAATATVNLTDNDSNVQFSAPATNISEKLTSVTLTVTRTGSTTYPATVAWAASNGSATAGSDYGSSGNSTPPSGLINFAAGTSQTITLPILADTVYEGNETITVTLSSPTGATLGVNPVINVTIQDDEAGAEFEQADYTVAEGAANIALKVIRIGAAPTATQTVKWAATNAGATAGQDYGTSGNASLPTGTLTWPAGDISAKTINLPIINDVAGEGDESFVVTLSNFTGGLASGSPNHTSVTIWDNDGEPESILAFTQAKYLHEEAVGNAELTVTRSGDPRRPASVKWTAANGSATAGSDYGIKGSVTVPSGTLNWLADDGGDKIISIPILDDTTTETMENFKVKLSANSVSTALGSLQQATVVIHDIDELFPTQGVLASDWQWPVNAPAGWHVAEDLAAAEGKYVVRSDTVFDDEAAQIQVRGIFVAGNVSFKLKVSSEENFDFLRFYVDGVKKGEWSGNQATNWTLTPKYPIAAGEHTLLWSYEKDVNTSLGQDAAWIDSVLIPEVTPISP